MTGRNHMHRNRRYYYKLLICMLLIAVIPIFIFSFVAYYNVSQTFREETVASNTKFLKQTMNAMEIIVKQIKESSHQLALNASFQNFESFPNGDYYENLSGSISKDVLAGNYKYVMQKKDAVYGISHFKLSNQYVYSVYYYDGHKDIVLASGEKNTAFSQHKFADFPDKDWYETAKELSFKEIILMKTRQVAVQGHENKEVISVIMGSNVKGNAFIVNLDAQLLYKEIIQKLASPHSLFVVSKTGHSIFGNRPETFESQIVEDVLSGRQGGSGWIATNNDNYSYLVTYAKSDLLDWIFVDINDLKSLNKGLDYLTRIMIASVLLLAAALLMTVYWSTRKLYMPVNGIMNVLSGKRAAGGGYASAVRKDEFGYIGEMVRGTLKEKEHFKKNFEENLPYYRERFLLALIRSAVMDAKEMEERRRYLALNLRLSEMLLLLISIDESMFGNRLGRMEELEVHRLRIADYALRHWRHAHAQTIDVGDGKLAVVLNAGEEERKDILISAHEFIERLAGSVTIGIGSGCADATQLPRAYKEASDALQYQVAFGSGQVIDISEVTLDKVEDYLLPKAKLDKLVGAVKMGDAEQAKIALRDLFHDKQKRARPLFVQLLTCLINTMNAVGTNIEKISSSDVFVELLGKPDAEETLSWLESLIEAVAAHIATEMRGKGGKHIERAMRIIDDNIDKDLSLQQVALELQLNPSYLSRLFKNFTGRTFIEYVTHQKIDKSKSLLLGSTSKVKDIAEHIGYHNTHYFIKLFKEIVGSTPGEYRKIHSESRLADIHDFDLS